MSALRLVLSQEDAHKPVFELLGRPARAITVTVVVPRGVTCSPYLDIGKLPPDSVITIENYGHLGESPEIAHE